MSARRHGGFTGIFIACLSIACFVVGFSLTRLLTGGIEPPSPPTGDPVVQEQQAEGSSDDYTGDPVEPEPVATAPATAAKLSTSDPARYIDRVDLPPYATFLYRWLEEATDFDGQDDWLIDDRYFSPTPGESTDGVETPGAIIALEDGYAVSLGATDVANGDEANSHISTAWFAFDQDHPEVFWLDNVFWMGGITLADGTYCPFLELGRDDWQMRAEGFESEDAIAQGIATRDAQVAAILGEAFVPGDAGATVRNLNDWLTAHNGYSTTVASGGQAPLFATTSLCALVGNSGEEGPVCEGYSRALKVLCDAAGIPCALSSGTGESDTGPGPHMWNIVQVDGQWYATDVTWNDPNAGDWPVSGLERDDYTLVGTGTEVDGMAFSDSHRLENMGPTGTPNLTNEPPLSPTAYSG